MHHEPKSEQKEESTNTFNPEADRRVFELGSPYDDANLPVRWVSGEFPRLYGFWSKRCEELYGYFIYLDEQGRKVIVTHVSPYYNDNGTFFGDTVLVGRVTRQLSERIRGAHMFAEQFFAPIPTLAGGPHGINSDKALPERRESDRLRQVLDQWSLAAAKTASQNLALDWLRMNGIVTTLPLDGHNEYYTRFDVGMPDALKPS